MAQLKLDLPRTPVMVMADHNRLAQVLNNLMDNAHKHAGPDASGPIELNVQWRDDHANVVVRDHGPGISSNDLLHIFDRFFISADSVTRQGGGAGLGLYICRRLLDAMHGGLEAHSTSGQGSSFVVRIPTLASQHAAKSEPAPRMVGGVERTRARYNRRHDDLGASAGA